MATGIFDYWTSFYYNHLEDIFGNYKNYRRWVETRRLNEWNNWLISLGYRE